MTHTAPLGPAARVYSSIRTRWPRGVSCCSDVAFALGTSLIWALLYNVRFWQQAVEAMWSPTLGGVLFMASLFAVVLLVHAMLLLLVPTRPLMRAAASVLFIIAAASSYFSNTYGAIMSKDMMRNVLETQSAEITGLLSSRSIAYVLLLGVVPAGLVWRVALPSNGWRGQLKQRVLFIPAALAISVGALFACSADYAVFFREHKPIRYSLSPAAPLSSLAGLLSRRHADAASQAPLLNPAGDALRVAPPRARPLVLFLVIGETARAANFQLGGYPRPTNPRLIDTNDLVYFKQLTSCSTSTAISVPCMFSHWGRSAFDVDEADRYTNLLDSLMTAGIDVEWRDNNAGCKGVCTRVAQISYANRPDARLCPNAYCYDEVMLADLPTRLRAVRRDTVIVFHQIGSHGPAYSERYPPAFERFKPACRSNELQHCTPEEIRNAYDNTIAYTDSIVSRQIELLRAASDRVDSALIYVSDHGESLGEQGLYLHGMPYSFAPQVQKHVPMLLWTSAGYAEQAHLLRDCLRSRAAKTLSHDNLYHTVLGAMGVRNQVYDAQRDLLFGCRAGVERGSHE